MTTITVNGRDYNVKDFMLWQEWDAACEAADEFGIVLLLKNLLDESGNPYPDEATLKSVLPCPDVPCIRKEIYRLNGFLDEEDADPLPSESDSNDG